MHPSRSVAPSIRRVRDWGMDADKALPWSRSRRVARPIGSVCKPMTASNPIHNDPTEIERRAAVHPPPRAALRAAPVPTPADPVAPEWVELAAGRGVLEVQARCRRAGAPDRRARCPRPHPGRSRRPRRARRALPDGVRRRDDDRHRRLRERRRPRDLRAAPSLTAQCPRWESNPHALSGSGF